MIAAYLVASSGRPRALWACLASIAQTVRVEGVRLEVFVCGHVTDRALEVARAWGVHVIPALESDGGSKFNLAAEAALAIGAKLALVTGDDDLPSPLRLALACHAFELGYPVSGVKEFRFVNLSTGQVAHWAGPAWRCGAQLNYDLQLLVQAGGWDQDGKRNLDWRLQQRIGRLAPGLAPADLGSLVACEAVCGHHPTAMSHDRPWPLPGATVQHYNFAVTGEDSLATNPRMRRVRPLLHEAGLTPGALSSCQSLQPPPAPRLPYDPPWQHLVDSGAAIPLKPSAAP